MCYVSFILQNCSTCHNIEKVEEEYKIVLLTVPKNSVGGKIHYFMKLSILVRHHTLNAVHCSTKHYFTNVNGI